MTLQQHILTLKPPEYISGNILYSYKVSGGSRVKNQFNHAVELIMILTIG